MKIILTITIILTGLFFIDAPVSAQNVGINNTTPNAPLSFANITGNKLDLFYNSATSRYGFGVQGSLFQMYANTAAADIAFGYGSSTSFFELMRIMGNGDVGIGTSLPLYKLDINGRARLRHVGGVSAGLWFNKADNSVSTFAGMEADSAWGLYNNGWKFIFDTKNGKLGIGALTPQYPLAFQSILGDKISLYGGGGLPNADHYGLGIQGSLMQLFTPVASADIAFGYGRSAAFTERMRIKGDGNVGIGTSTPSTKLQILGGADAGLTSNGFIQLGPTTSGNLVIDNNEIVVRNNGLKADMWIQQDDGNLMLCGLGLGTVGVGVSAASGLATGYALSVKGKIIAEEVRVQAYANWPDYVFNPSYPLMSLDELRKSIESQKRLPNIPSAKEMEENGILVGDMQKRMMEKIEELTLYVLDLHDINIHLQAEIGLLKSDIDKLNHK